MSGAETAIVEDEAARSPPGRFLWATTGIFTALTVLLFWRYSFGFATTVSDSGDPVLLMWIMAWVQRALLHSPTELLNAPMFHPFQSTLAYSDPLLPQSIVALPLRALGFGPVAQYNFVYLSGIVVAGVLTAFLFFEVTGNRIASWLGAAVATFPSLRLYHLAHMQLQVTTFLPLSLLLVHRIVTSPSRRGSAALAATLVAAPLASLYFGMFLAILLPPFTLALWGCARERSVRTLPAIGVAAVASAVALYPFGRAYSRAIGHLAVERTDRISSELQDYVGISQFCDLARILPSRVVASAAPEWVGGAGTLLIPVAAAAITFLLARSLVRSQSVREVPEWAWASAPYAVLGCFALALSFGPDVRWRGHVLFKNPLGFVANLPGVRDIRNFQRAGFIVAIAAGALLAIVLSEIDRRRLGRASWAARLSVGLTTIVPVFSSSLPAYRPPPPAALSPVYKWVEEQPDPMVLFEVPLPPRGANESLDYLWAALWHKKAIVHGYSGYLPLTDSALRAEVGGVHRPDFFRSLALVGATHLVVHPAELVRHTGGAGSLARLREARAADRVAQFEDAEVYRVEPNAGAVVTDAEGALDEPKLEAGGWVDPAHDCVEFGANTQPLVYYAPKGNPIVGLKFIAGSPLGELDDALLVEFSNDLRSWRSATHRPLLSTALAVYLSKPTPDLWAYARVSAEPGPFIRLTSRRGDQRLRICGARIESTGVASLEMVVRSEMSVRANVGQGAAALADGDPVTRWQSGRPQLGGEYLDVDLDHPRLVAAVVLDLGSANYDYGRELQIDCGTATEDLVPGRPIDGSLVLFSRPRPQQIVPLSPPRACKLLRIRQIANAPDNYWSAAEIGVLELLERSPSARE